VDYLAPQSGRLATEAFQNRLFGMSGCGKNLEDPDRSVLDPDKVGERAAGVDRDSG